MQIVNAAVDLFAKDETCGFGLGDIVIDRSVGAVNETPDSRSFTGRLRAVFVVLITIGIQGVDISFKKYY